MTTVLPSLILAAYALLAMAFGPMLAIRADLSRRAPRLGLLVWLALPVSVIAACLLALLMLAVPAAVAGHGLVEVWYDCVGRLGHYYGPLALGVALTAAAVGAAMVTRLAVSAGTHAWRTRRVRREHLQALAIVAPATADGVVVVPHSVPYAYCLPGSAARIVVTDAAVRLLEPDQLQGVLAHEREHLRGRHAALVGFVASLHRAFPGIPLFRQAHNETSHVVEVLADDAGTKVCGADRLVLALLNLARTDQGNGALAASGADASRRAWRLVDPPPRLGRIRLALAWTALIATVVLPIVATAVPVVFSIDLSNHQHITGHDGTPV